jgi:hypothetical protein
MKPAIIAIDNFVSCDTDDILYLQPFLRMRLIKTVLC